MVAPFAAIVLAGGGSRRLAGADKCWLEVAGQPIMESVVTAVAGAANPAPLIVVVGPRRDLITPVRWTREDPPGAGPVAGLQAGLAALDAARVASGSRDEHNHARPDQVLVLAGDMPFVGLGLPELLRVGGDPRIDATVAQDPSGRDQYLLALWRVPALREALKSAAPNASLRSLYRDVAVTRCAVPATATLDCDTPAELAQARALGLIQPEPG